MSAEPKRVELTEAERGQLFAAGDHHPDMCDCTGYAAEFEYAPDSEEVCEALVNTFVVVERIVAARVQAAKAELLAEATVRIESLAADYANGGQTLSWQGARHCVETVLAEPERDEADRIVASVTKPTEYEETQP